MEEHKITSFNDLKKEILMVFYKYPNESFNYKQLYEKMDLNNSELKSVLPKVLIALEKQNKLINIKKEKYKLTMPETIITGKIDMTSNGAAYVVSEDREEDVYIPQKKVKNILDGDIVRVKLHSNKEKNKQRGTIIEVIERAKTKFVGILQVSQNFAFLVADDKNIHVDIYIPRGKFNKNDDGKKAIVKIVKWKESSESPEGKIVEILGMPGTYKVEMRSIMSEFDLPVGFSKPVMQETKQLDLEISEQEIKARKDFRSVPTFTIDPDDAKDFDDALSIRKLKNNNWEVGIHIADVTHYVQPDKEIDKEAYERATSVYLVGKVAPMLPEILSNKVCSLRPEEEKLTFSAVFELDKNAEIKNSWFGKTVIKSNKRFTYKGAQDIIETKKGDFSEEVLQLNQLAGKLRAERFNNGAISFEKTEVGFKLDEEGKPIGVFEKVMKESNKLIEEFMLLANRKVAEFIGEPHKNTPEKLKTFLYRVHDLPDTEKLEQFSAFISRFGYKINNKSPRATALSLNKVLQEVKGKPEENIVGQLAIRTMAKAVYTTNNIGHYGLGFDFYTHFTSPIRRYPDMLVHRMLQHYLEGGNSVNKALIEKQCKHCSEMEKVATDAERSSIKYKQVEYLSDKIGQVFIGVVSGVTDFGIFVEIKENKCEGMIRLSDIKGDYFEFQEKNMCVEGRKKSRKIHLGDEVDIKIKSAHLNKRQLDFELV